jgi:hypothetical protein
MTIGSTTDGKNIEVSSAIMLSDIPELQRKIDREEQERWRDMLIASRPDLKAVKRESEVINKCEN